MIKNFTVGVYNKAPSTKINGITIPGVLTWVEDLELDIQPYSTALLLKNYGYNIEVDKRMFLDSLDENIKIGTILKYVDKYGKNINLEVKTIPWDDGYMEFMGLGVSI
jgi:hypothetical protein